MTLVCPVTFDSLEMGSMYENALMGKPVELKQQYFSHILIISF